MRGTTLVLIFTPALFECLLLGITPAARAQEGPQPPPPIEQVYQMPLVYSMAGMDKVQVRRDSFTYVNMTLTSLLIKTVWRSGRFR